MIVIACAASGNVFGDITLQPSPTKSGEVRAPTGNGDSGAPVFDYSGTNAYLYGEAYASCKSGHLEKRRGRFYFHSQVFVETLPSMSPSCSNTPTTLFIEERPPLDIVLK